MKSIHNRLIRLIALFKLLKAALLIAVGMSALHLMHKDVASVAEHLVTMFGLDPGDRLRRQGASKNRRPHSQQNKEPRELSALSTRDYF